jgi:hypothetical protein
LSVTAAADDAYAPYASEDACAPVLISYNFLCNSRLKIGGNEKLWRNIISGGDVRIEGLMMSKHHKLILSIALLAFCLAGCRRAFYQLSAAPHQPAAEDVPLADGFDYPVGKTRSVTQKKDGDGWYNAQDFTENQHLAEDWNGDGGGNTDCGQPVYAAARGVVIYTQDALGWGNVVIIRHRLPDGAQIETQYGHLQNFTVKPGDKVERRQQIGTIGDGGGRFLCHLHFELRTADCPAWGAPGPGYGGDTKGWLDPSDFIDTHRPATR